MFMFASLLIYARLQRGVSRFVPADKRKAARAKPDRLDFNPDAAAY
jgi:hypothetical protein